MRMCVYVSVWVCVCLYSALGKEVGALVTVKREPMSPVRKREDKAPSRGLSVLVKQIQNGPTLDPVWGVENVRNMFTIFGTTFGSNIVQWNLFSCSCKTRLFGPRNCKQGHVGL